MLENRAEARKYIHKAIPVLTETELNRLMILLEGMCKVFVAKRNIKTA